MTRMHSCRRVAELLSRRLDEPLGLIDRFRLRVHLSICGNCRHVEEQLDSMHALSADLFAADGALEDDDEARRANHAAPTDRSD
jgi:predicted anti-sigma-YlaC factor YlaD